MFEDSTFESMGKIRTRSRGWLIATFAFNGSILLALVLIPLMYPAALPRIASAIQMTVPPPPEQEPRPAVRPVHAQTSRSELDAARRIQAPSVIPNRTWIPGTREEPTPINIANLGDANDATGPGSAMGGGHSMHPDVRQAPASTARLSKGVMEGMLVHKVLPVYPPMARSIHVEGTVELQATISRSGTIENLRVVNGPPLLQQAARDAVMQWGYQPYLLNGEPVEVETTINVEFKLE